MINSSKAFEFNGIRSDSFWISEYTGEEANRPLIYNITLNNDFYQTSLLGERKIIEEKIQGRDNPYLYDVDHSPLQFEMNIAFDRYVEASKINNIIDWLYGPRTYKKLVFDENTDIEFFGIFIGEPKLNYVGNNKTGYKYVGYLTVTFRLNAPYGYTPVITESGLTSNFSVNNTGNLTTYPSFDIINTGGINTVTLSSATGEQVDNSILLIGNERIVPYDNNYDSTVVTTENRVLRHDGVSSYIDITGDFNFGPGETISGLVSGFSGCLLYTSANRFFAWGTRSRDGWLIAPNSTTGSTYTDNNPVEITSTIGPIIGSDTVIAVNPIAYTGGIYLSTTQGKLVTWGFNYYGVALVPTTSTVSYAAPADRSSELTLNPGEYVEEVSNYQSYKVLIRTSDNRYFNSQFINSRWRVALSTGNPESIFNPGEQFIKQGSSQLNDQYHFTNQGRIIRTNSSLTPSDITSYYDALLDSGESISSMHTPLLLEFFSGSTYIPLYFVTSNGRVLASGPIPGTALDKFYTQPVVLDLSTVLNATTSEIITNITFNNTVFDGSLHYIVSFHTSDGRVLMYNVRGEVLEPLDLVTFGLITSSFTYVFDGNDTLSFNGYTKSLSLLSGDNAYPGWDKNYLLFEPGNNDIIVSATGAVEIEYAFRAPKYI